MKKVNCVLLIFTICFSSVFARANDPPSFVAPEQRSAEAELIREEFNHAHSDLREPPRLRLPMKIAYVVPAASVTTVAVLTARSGAPKANLTGFSPYVFYHREPTSPAWAAVGLGGAALVVGGTISLVKEKGKGKIGGLVAIGAGAALLALSASKYRHNH